MLHTCFRDFSDSKKPALRHNRSPSGQAAPSAGHRSLLSSCREISGSRAINKNVCLVATEVATLTADEARYSGTGTEFYISHVLSASKRVSQRPCCSDHPISRYKLPGYLRPPMPATEPGLTSRVCPPLRFRWCLISAT